MKKQKASAGRRAAQRLAKPFPPTAPIPDVGLTLFGVTWAKAYALAREGVIDTIATGARGKLGLVHKTCEKLGINPND
jgi:hypothetical protein